VNPKTKVLKLFLDDNAVIKIKAPDSIRVRDTVKHFGIMTRRNVFIPFSTSATMPEVATNNGKPYILLKYLVSSTMTLSGQEKPQFVSSPPYSF
jgi:hypothetical protein